MKFDEVIVLLPCQSLEEFPSHLQGADAEGLLAGWSAIWHPALLAATGRLPSWRKAEAAETMAGEADRRSGRGGAGDGGGDGRASAIRRQAI